MSEPKLISDRAAIGKCASTRLLHECTSWVEIRWVYKLSAFVDRTACSDSVRDSGGQCIEHQLAGD